MNKHIDDMAKVIREADIRFAKANVEHVEKSLIFPYNSRSEYLAASLFSDGYCKSTDVVEEIFAEIGKILRKFDEMAERDRSEYGELIVGDITASIAELKKKYTEEME
jgi:spore germination protein YaaH